MGNPQLKEMLAEAKGAITTSVEQGSRWQTTRTSGLGRARLKDRPTPRAAFFSSMQTRQARSTNPSSRREEAGAVLQSGERSALAANVRGGRRGPSGGGGRSACGSFRGSANPVQRSA